MNNEEQSQIVKAVTRIRETREQFALALKRRDEVVDRVVDAQAALDEAQFRVNDAEDTLRLLAAGRRPESGSTLEDLMAENKMFDEGLTIAEVRRGQATDPARNQQKFREVLAARMECHRREVVSALSKGNDFGELCRLLAR